MNDFGFPRRKQKTIEELNVVPILDMFVSIVFFLLLSASMVGMTKIVLPPSSTSSVESGSTKVPLNPKLFVLAGSANSQSVKVILRWEGAAPGNDSLTLNEDVFNDQRKPVDEIKQMVQRFKDKFPEEKTIQISLQSGVPYQWLISAMDGVREILPDMVLNSYHLADTMSAEAP